MSARHVRKMTSAEVQGLIKIKLKMKLVFIPLGSYFSIETGYECSVSSVFPIKMHAETLLKKIEKKQKGLGDKNAEMLKYNCKRNTLSVTGL